MIKMAKDKQSKKTKMPLQPMLYCSSATARLHTSCLLLLHCFLSYA